MPRGIPVVGSANVAAAPIRSSRPFRRGDEVDAVERVGLIAMGMLLAIGIYEGLKDAWRRPKKRDK
jgi:hypothetical protein